jgi:adenylate kinase
VSSGDLFRKHLAERTESRFNAKTYLEKGELVPGDMTLTLVLERMLQPDCLPGILLDGFPRTLAQAQALDHHLHQMRRCIDLAIYLKVPREELLRRLAGRYMCRAHQHVYNLWTHPPKKPGVCDIDGSELYQRADDKGEAVQKRLEIFFQETVHLLGYYREQHKLVTINGCQDIDQVYMDMMQAIQKAVGSEETCERQNQGP